jgi:phage/plasmid-like protein (TIGR03299 family)
MSANINFNSKTGKYSVMVVQEPAWHGLGQVLTNKATSKEAIIEAQLDFKVSKRPVLYSSPSVNRTLDNNFVTVRDDTNNGFGVVGNTYQVLQNIDAFKFFDSIVGKGEAIYTSAGALYDGRTIFISAKLPDYIRVNGDDIEKYLLLTNTHDGTRSVQILFTPVRVVCSNTLNAALCSKSSRISIRHSKDTYIQLENAAKVMGISNLLSKELETMFTNWTKTLMTDIDVIIYLAKVLLNTEDYLIQQQDLMLSDTISTKGKNIIKTAFNSYYGGVGQDKIRGTLYGAYNGLTNYLSNSKQYIGIDNHEAFSKRADSMLFGDAYNKSDKGFELASIINTNKESLYYK